MREGLSEVHSAAYDTSISRQSRSHLMIVDGEEVGAIEGESVAAVLTRLGKRTFRRTRIADEPRGMYCGIGQCYDCLVSVNGRANVRACVTATADGMVVETVREQRDGNLSEPTAADDSSQHAPMRAPDISTELAVVGAGPAGIEAALAAANAGMQVILIDSGHLPGGQYFKQTPIGLQNRTASANEPEATEVFRQLDAHPGIRVLSETLVWGAFLNEDGGWLLRLHGPASPFRCLTRTLIVASGAYDRPIVFPGWTLPGILTAGAVRTLVRTQGVVPGRRFILSGSGPLQLLLAADLVEAGAEVIAVLEAARPSSLLRPRFLPALPQQMSRLREGWSAWRVLKKRRVPLRFGWSLVAARGQEQVDEVDVARLDIDWKPIPGTSQTFDVDTAVVGYGFVPAAQITRLLGCKHIYQPERGGWIPLRDRTMQTSLPGCYAVGDGAGVGGVKQARLEGRIAGLAVARREGRIGEASYRTTLIPLLKSLSGEARFAGFIAESFMPGPGMYTLAEEDTLICRCEEVSLGDIQGALSSGCRSLNEVKGMTRAGMGNCQGRVCEHQIARSLVDPTLAREEIDSQLEGLGCLSVRPPLHPMTLSELANSHLSGDLPSFNSKTSGHDDQS